MAFLLKHSQNYLRNPNLVTYLIKKSSITNQDTVIDIGAGKGIITEALSKLCGQVYAVEKDNNSAEFLKRKFSNNQKVKIEEMDFLNYPLPQSGEYKVFSNIPFTITADILKKILNANNPPTDSYIIIQQEAASKFSGQPYGSETLTSLAYKPWFKFGVVYVFKPGDFNPIPRVTPVLFKIERRRNTDIELESKETYRDFITYGFTTNPQIKKSFQKVFGNIEFNKLAKQFGFSVDAKPTDVTYEQWLELFNHFIDKVPKEKPGVIRGAFKRLLSAQGKLAKIHRTRR